MRRGVRRFGRGGDPLSGEVGGPPSLESAVRNADRVGTTLEAMVNGAIHMLSDPDGTLVANAAFDLSSAQFTAAAHAVAAVKVERHRDVTLDTDGVLELRELTAICDELGTLASSDGHGTVVLTLARLVMLHDSLVQFSGTRHDADHVREEDREALPIVDGLLAPMNDLRTEGLHAVLGTGAPQR